jgi:hypothetical protein
VKVEAISKMMWKSVGGNINMTVPWYLMGAYAYYELDAPILTDGDFDHLAPLMLKFWGSIQHRHKAFITEDDLRAGSLLRRDFPEITKGAVLSLIQR